MSKKYKFVAVLFALSLILGGTLRAFESFSEFYTLNVAPFFRVPLSFISSLFPFSLGESAVLILVILAVTLVLSGIKLLIIRIFKLKITSRFTVYLNILFFSLCFIYFIYSFGFQSSYTRTPIHKTIELETLDMTEENIADALDEVIEEMNLLIPQLQLADDGSTYSDMSFDEMSEEVLTAAKKASYKYPVYQKHPFKAKQIAFSEPLAYTRISGIYSFFTGESNINTAYFGYAIPFTIAHEYSHQMGVGSEKEAEFSALLICLESDDPYVRYSAYSQVAITLGNLLFSVDDTAFYRAFSKFPNCFITDMYLSSRDTQKYTETVADEIATAVNDTYLSLSGDGGVISYSLSAQLYVAYFLRSK